jgi:hypothetical integral membrane protein (TIGR02206 family)
VLSTVYEPFALICLFSIKEMLQCKLFVVVRGITIIYTTNMKRFLICSVVFLTGIIISIDIRGVVSMWKPYGLQLHTPAVSYIQPLDIPLGGLAWSKEGDIFLQAFLINPETGEIVASQKINRDRIVYKGTVLYELASFRTHIHAPDSGKYLLRVELQDAKGTLHCQCERALNVSAQAPVTEFRMFSTSHLVALSIICLLVLGIFWITRNNRLSSQTKTLIAFCMIVIMLLNEVVYHLYWQHIGAWSVSTALMIQMCGLSIVLLPWIFIVKPGKLGIILFELVYYWGLGGAMQALLTPDIGLLGFPSYKFFSFFISHALIILLTVYASRTLPYKITAKSMVRVIVISNIILVFIYFINKAIALLPPYEVGNYFVLMYPPVTGSLVDVFVQIFGPSPWYFIGFELMGLVVFSILTLPWYIGKVKKNNSTL